MDSGTTWHEGARSGTTWHRREAVKSGLKPGRSCRAYSDSGSLAHGHGWFWRGGRRPCRTRPTLARVGGGTGGATGRARQGDLGRSGLVSAPQSRPAQPWLSSG